MIASRVSGLAGLAAVLTFCGGCGPGKPTDRTPDSAPPEYRQYLRDGKVVATGNATLDYWVHINVFVATLKGPQNDLALRGVLQSLAKFVREKSVAGVDPDVARWGAGVAGVLETKAGIQTQLNDPATMRLAREKVAAGQPDPFALSNSPWRIGSASGTGSSPKGSRCRKSYLNATPARSLRPSCEPGGASEW